MPAILSGMNTMTLTEALKELKALGDEKIKKQNAKRGAGENQFGVSRGDLRKVANKIKSDHKLALELWDSNNVDAQFLATLIIKVKELSADEMERLVRTASYSEVADWLHSYVLKDHADKEKLRQKWMTSKEPLLARAAWRMTAGRVAKGLDDVDPAALLDRIEKEMPKADPLVQWTMNMCLAETGINHPKLRKRALAIGEKLGIYRDYPCAKGCTSPFAPIWINEMVKRQKAGAPMFAT
jgi:3-methyladenine DNA glycosylase AlkD